MHSSSPLQQWEAIFFDFFNTLVHFDYSLLPEVDFEGARIRTTSVEVYRRLEENFTVSFSYRHFLQEFRESRRTVEKITRLEDREVSSLRRFQILEERLALETDSAAEFMAGIHMAEMSRMMYFPAENRAVFERLSNYPLVLVSNFDHAPTVRSALRRFGMEKRFSEIFISEEVGWRKPSENLFRVVLERSGAAAEHSLYVGDDPWADVYGGVRAGFQVAWLAERETSMTPALAPRWIIHSLAEILDLVNLRC